MRLTEAHPEIILAGRWLNDSMGVVVASETVKLMIAKGIPVKDARVLVLGITFKEDCSDIRNSRVIDVIRELRSFGCQADLAYLWADAGEVMQEYGVTLIPYESVSVGSLFSRYSTVVFAVKHEAFS